MKIFYGIAGEGLGHATRSRPLIQHLAKRHSVRIFAGGKAFSYISPWFPATNIESLRLKYHENSLSFVKTFLYNFVKLPFYFLSFFKVFTIMMFHRPNAVITDFEPWTAWSALLLRIPVISIHLPGHYLPPQPFLSNNPSLAKTGLQNHCFVDRFLLWLVTTIIMPYADKVVIPSFFRISLNDKRAQFVDPIVRDEIRKRKSVIGTHVLVYQTAGTYHELLSVLKQFPQQQFIIYGFAKSGTEQNIVFKSFNETEFFDDLCSAKGVITNGGISFMTESVFLGKLILSIPINGHGEQLVNAFFLEKTRHGIAAGFASQSVIADFLKIVDGKKYLRRKNWSTEKTCAVIENLLKSLVTG